MRENEQQSCGGATDRRAEPGGDIGLAKYAESKSIDQVEEGIEVTNELPLVGQNLNRVEDTREEGERVDEEILKGGHMVPLLCIKGSNESECS